MSARRHRGKAMPCPAADSSTAAGRRAARRDPRPAPCRVSSVEPPGVWVGSCERIVGWRTVRWSPPLLKAPGFADATGLPSSGAGHDA